MKKLSIVLALIMALSCLSITAFAATTEKAPDAAVKIVVKWATVDGSAKDDTVLNYALAANTKLTPEMILNAVKNRLDGTGNPVVDPEEYVLADKVVSYDDVDLDGVEDDQYIFTGTTVKSGEDYYFEVFATEINDVAVFATTLGEQLAKLDWGGIAKANVSLYNQIIAGTKAAVETLVKELETVETATKADDADEAPEKDVEAAEKTEAPVETPDTGVSAVAGAAVAVLALSATTAVVLRKKED